MVCFSLLILHYRITIAPASDLGKDNLRRPRQSSEVIELVQIEIRIAPEGCQYGKGSASHTLWYGDLSAVGTTARDFRICDIGDLVKKTDVEWLVGIDSDEECARVISES